MDECTAENIANKPRIFHPHNTYSFTTDLEDLKTGMITFRSDFDSGNCGNVIKKSNLEV